MTFNIEKVTWINILMERMSKLKKGNIKIVDILKIWTHPRRKPKMLI